MTDVPNPPPLSDEEIQAAAVGDLPEYNATIELAEYDPDWPRLYEREAERIRGRWGRRRGGSSMWARRPSPGSRPPLIDIVLVVADTRDEDAYVRRSKQSATF